MPVWCWCSCFLFQFGSYAEMINSAVKAHTGYVQIQAQGYLKDKEMHRVIQDPKAVKEAIKGISSIKAYTSRANGFALVSSKDRTYGVGVIGVEPQGEAKVSTIASMIRRVTTWPKATPARPLWATCWPATCMWAWATS